MVLLGLVEHLAFGGDADEPGEAEGATGHVLGEAADGVEVAGLQADGAIDAKAAVVPGAHLLDEFRFDAVFIQQQLEDLVFPEAQERFVGEVDRQAMEDAVGELSIDQLCEVKSIIGKAEIIAM